MKQRKPLPMSGGEEAGLEPESAGKRAEKAPKDGDVSRRGFIRGGVVAGAAAGAALLGTQLPAEARAVRSSRTEAEEDYGVASGDPRADSVVIWTWMPLSTRPASGNLSVIWEVSESSTFGTLAASGTFSTGADRDFTVKVKVTGLRSFTPYFYRFRTASGYVSIVGQTLTAPGPTESVSNLRFAFVSCQKYTYGYYNVLKTLATEDADFIVHLGDAVYETGGDNVRSDHVGEVQSNRAINLNDWRNKWKLYLSDPDMKAARQRFPWIYIWDDHEVYNDFAGGDAALPASDRDIQRNAYQAYTEFVPLDPARTVSVTNGIPALQIYRSFQFGPLMDLFAIDSRQYRGGTVCSRDVATPGCEDLYSPDRTMLGAAQADWLIASLGASTARWRFIANQVMMMALKLSNNALPIVRPEDTYETYDGYIINTDQWDGFPAERDRILGYIRDNDISNVVVLTGDFHNCFAGHLKVDFTDRKAPAVAVEFVGGSVTSSGIAESTGGWDASSFLLKTFKPANPHMEWLDAKWHVYTLVDVTPEKSTIRFVKVSTVTSQTYTASVLRDFTVPDGQSTVIPGQI